MPPSAERRAKNQIDRAAAQTSFACLGQTRRVCRRRLRRPPPTHNFETVFGLRKEKAMKLFGPKNKTGRGAATVQTARSVTPSSFIQGFPTPLSKPEFAVFDAMRSSVPIIDSAIEKIIRLIGKFEVECESAAATRALSHFLEKVKTGPCSAGMVSFLTAYIDSLLMYGSAAGEMVIGEKSGKILGLYNADIRCLEMKYGTNPLEAKLYTKDAVTGQSLPIPHPERILLSAINTSPASPNGRSMLEGLPFVSSILMKIYSSIGTNWERAGNLRYAVTYNPDPASADCGSAEAEELAKEWQKAMNDSSQVRDFVAVGDVKIKVIGSDGPILDSEIPVRQMLEQIVAKCGIPPFLFGLSWSTTERMSSQQADILTSELEYYRNILAPVISKICSEFLFREGFGTDHKIIWNEICLQDEVELARARLYKAQAEKLEKENSL